MKTVEEVVMDACNKHMQRSFDEEQIAWILQEFARHWGKKVDAGHVSGMSRLEEMAVGIFARWLCENYDLSKREGK